MRFLPPAYIFVWPPRNQSSVMDNRFSTTSSTSLLEKRAYDAETKRLERRGRRITTVSTTLTAILRILTFLLQSETILSSLTIESPSRRHPLLRSSSSLKQETTPMDL